jgi:5-methylcytosine-specific restriction protein A
MPRKNFKRSIIVARYKHCGGRCEGVLENGKRCFAVVKPGAYHCDHDDPDGLTGEPTFENARILCIPCHKAKTKDDVALIAQAKRREADHLGAFIPPKRKIQSRPFPKRPKKKRIELAPLVRRALYAAVTAGAKERM